VFSFSSGPRRLLVGLSHFTIKYIIFFNEVSSYCANTSVVDPDPHHFDNLDPHQDPHSDPDPHQIKNTDTDPYPDPHQSNKLDKLDPEPYPDPHLFAEDMPKCM
jgi:hypothetical protein